MAQQISESGTSTAPIVVVDGVGKSFRVEAELAPALRDVSFTVNDGNVLGIVGRSGAGKSTLLRLVGGLLALDSGAISIDGFTPEQARGKKHFGFMPQAPALLPWKTAAQNVELLSRVNKGAGRDAMNASDALSIVGLSRVSNMLPHQLSGGMRQRVSLARAIATRAPILLLDEPFSELDEVTRVEMRRYIDSLRGVGNHTIIFVTHDITEAVLLADDVMVLQGSPGHVGAVADVRGIDLAVDAQARVAALRELLMDTAS